MTASATSATEKHEIPQRPLVLPSRPLEVDPALQVTAGPLVGTTAGLSFAGVGNGDYGFAPDAAPPDTNMAVGATQVVQWVNESFAVFNKSTGALVYGPAAGNTLWAGFGGGCQTNNDGDPIVAYDKLNQRWIVTQFSVSTTPYLECVAVSTTSDATGTYNRYAFDYGTTQFNDYPKLGVWPDAYYMTTNQFLNGGNFDGAGAFAFDFGTVDVVEHRTLVAGVGEFVETGSDASLDYQQAAQSGDDRDDQKGEDQDEEGDAPDNFEADHHQPPVAHEHADHHEQDGKHVSDADGALRGLHRIHAARKHGAQHTPAIHGIGRQQVEQCQKDIHRKQTLHQVAAGRA